MHKIGVVLSGCAGKGPYEVGAMKAIVDYFGIENIKCVSSASIGAVIAQAHAIDRETELMAAFRDIDSGKYGRHILGYSVKEEAFSVISALTKPDSALAFEHYVCIWNLTGSKTEYIPFHELDPESTPRYVQGAISIPIFSKGVVIDEQRYFDGAFLDNIPVYPLVDKDIDFIICVYFDNCRYSFESEEFDKKIIKLYDFPNRGMIDTLFYELGTFDEMYKYGYEYSIGVFKEIFENRTDKEEILSAIADYNKNRKSENKSRLTADVVLNNINVVTRRYFKPKTIREKNK